MALLFSSVCFFLLAFVSIGSAQEDDRVKVSAYYETLCPDSIAFIKYQLWPTYKAMPEILNIELIPYGKASYEEQTDGTVTFRCQHGPRECYGNTVQACAINQLGDIDQALPFVHCMESKRNPDRAGPGCAERLNITTWSDIRDCASSTEGQQYLLELGKKTHGLSPRVTFVPWININDNHSDDNQDLALTNLMKLVCDNYTGDKRPSTCAQYSNQGHTPVTTESAETTVSV